MRNDASTFVSTWTNPPKHVKEPTFCRPSGTSAPRYAEPVEVEQVLASDKLPHIGTFSKPSGETPRRAAITPVRCVCGAPLKVGRESGLCSACNEDKRRGNKTGFPLRLLNQLDFRDTLHYTADDLVRDTLADLEEAPPRRKFAKAERKAVGQ